MKRREVIRNSHRDSLAADKRKDFGTTKRSPLDLRSAPYSNVKCSFCVIHSHSVNVNTQMSHSWHRNTTGHGAAAVLLTGRRVKRTWLLAVFAQHITQGRDQSPRSARGLVDEYMLEYNSAHFSPEVLQIRHDNPKTTAEGLQHHLSLPGCRLKTIS